MAVAVAVAVVVTPLALAGALGLLVALGHPAALGLLLLVALGRLLVATGAGGCVRRTSWTMVWWWCGGGGGGGGLYVFVYKNMSMCRIFI